MLLPIVGGRGREAALVAADLAAEIEWAKARLVTPDRYARAATEAGRNPPRPIPHVADLFRAYEREKRKRGPSRNNAGPPQFETRPVVADEDSPLIVKTKQFAVKPMSPEEAVLQLELIGHDFFVFQNAETNDVNVVYRRRDGNYGLIEPQVA